MVMIAICTLLLGAALSTRFRVHVLVPATILGLALVVSIATLKGSGATLAMGVSVVWAISVQLGYLGGLLCTAATRPASDRSLRPTITQS